MEKYLDSIGGPVESDEDEEGGKKKKKKGKGARDDSEESSGDETLVRPRSSDHSLIFASHLTLKVRSLSCFKVPSPAQPDLSLAQSKRPGAELICSLTLIIFRIPVPVRRRTTTTNMDSKTTRMRMRMTSRQAR